MAQVLCTLPALEWKMVSDMTNTQVRESLHKRKILMTRKEEYPTLSMLAPKPYMARPTCEHLLNKPLQNGQVQCTARAAYKVNGVLMCERHAGREFLMAHLRRIGFNKKHGDKLG